MTNNPTFTGKVTSAERDTIQALYERKNSLEELAMIVPAGHPLYEKMLADTQETQKRYAAWWAEKSAKYDWPSIQGGSWSINFETCEITLTDKCSACNNSLNQ